MSLQDRIKAAKSKKTKFIVSAGLRFGGKTASLGTLPGKTLLAVIGTKESGAAGAVKVAEITGNHIDVIDDIHDGKDAVAVARQAFEDGYDNVAVDGLSAITEVEAEKPKAKKMLDAGGNSVFAGWRIIGTETINMIQELKELSTEYNKPVILTMALKDPKADSTGNLSALEADIKGQMPLGFIKGKCPYFVCARLVSDKDGNPVHVLQTKPDSLYPCRLDGVIAKDLPVGFRTELDKLEAGQPVGFDALLQFLSQY